MEYLIYISIILLMGTLMSVLARHLNISSVFFLLLMGMVFGSLDLISFPADMVITISLLALIMIVFDGTVKFKFREVLTYSSSALKLTALFFVSNFIFLTFFTKLLFGLKSWSMPFLLSALVCGSDPATALSVLGNVKRKAVEILEIESLINTPLVVIIPITILKYVSTKTFFSRFSLSNQFWMVSQQIIIGLTVGIVMGFLIVFLMRNFYMKDQSYLTILTAAIITYVSAELINGSGVLSVTVFGLIFGNLRMEHKIELKKYASVFTNTLKILVFVLMGAVLVVKQEYILKGTLLFAIYSLIRFGSVYIATMKDNLLFKEKIFMTLNMPKGVDVIVVILLMLSQYSSIEHISVVINIGLLFVLLSIVLSTMAGIFIPLKKTKKN